MSPLEAHLRSIAEARATAEPAHDFSHVRRVTANARRIGQAEGADLDVVVPAALLHELFNYPKGHPESHRSGEVCAGQARDVLREAGCSDAIVERVATAIAEHPFSRGIVPGTLEGKVLQD
ncbi:MAG TPA: HD domain-containing protein, partial [Polyangiaceae bacterium]